MSLYCRVGGNQCKAIVVEDARYLDAITNDDVDRVRDLIVDTDPGPVELADHLVTAVEFGAVRTAGLLIGQGARSSTIEEVTGRNLLHIAVICNFGDYRKMIAMLIGAGVRLNTLDADGYTPLDYAVESRKTDIAIDLIKAGGRCARHQRWADRIQQQADESRPERGPEQR